mmetsp:Transcript_65147/g.103179  ORF Transcript_65147/g.103179 Transcript_65147/m.103179 type:complete len:96 (+) Transcript_65147:1186-1473(+)
MQLWMRGLVQALSIAGKLPPRQLCGLHKLRDQSLTRLHAWQYSFGGRRSPFNGCWHGGQTKNVQELLTRRRRQTTLTCLVEQLLGDCIYSVNFSS